MYSGTEYSVNCFSFRKSTLSTFWWAAQQGDHVLHHNQKGNCLHVWFGIGYSVFVSLIGMILDKNVFYCSIVNMSAIYTNNTSSLLTLAIA